MLAPYIIGAIVAAIGLVLIFLGKATGLVNIRYLDVELTLPAGLLLVIIGVAIVVFPIGANVLASKDANPGQDSPASTIQTTTNAPTPTTQNPALRPIKIDPVNTPVPCHTKFTGTGDVPSDRVLWLITQQLGSPPKYYSKPVFVNVAEHKWIAANVTIGTRDTPPGSLYMIYAVLVDDATNQLLKQRHSKDWLANIPGRQVDQIQVSRSGDGTGC